LIARGVPPRLAIEFPLLIERFTDAPPRPAPHRVRLAGYCIGALAAALFATPAASEIYFSDASVEVSGVGPRPSRNCTVLLRPAQTFGENAPRLTLVTSGAAQLSFGVEKPGQYSGLVIVQNNTRQPLVGADNASIEQFRVSDLGKAIRSQRLFFVTAQRSDSGKFVSSRYERIGFDAILAKVETACPFDAESLMTDLSARQRAEQALSISASDLVLIRWALTKKYSGSSTKPEPSASLSPQERAYLKRYAADSGLALSQYLTTDTARKLIAEAQLAAFLAPRPPLPPAPKQNFWSFNGSRMALRVEADKPGRVFVYESPSDSLRRAGVSRGAVAFSGERTRDRYTGKAYAFAERCPPAAFEVTGAVLNDHRQVMLQGKAPIRDRSCRVTGHQNEILNFVFHDIEDNWGEP